MHLSCWSLLLLILTASHGGQDIANKPGNKNIEDSRNNDNEETLHRHYPSLRRKASDIRVFGDPNKYKDHRLTCAEVSYTAGIDPFNGTILSEYAHLRYRPGLSRLRQLPAITTTTTTTVTNTTAATTIATTTSNEVAGALIDAQMECLQPRIFDRFDWIIWNLDPKCCSRGGFETGNFSHPPRSVLIRDILHRPMFRRLDYLTLLPELKAGEKRMLVVACTDHRLSLMLRPLLTNSSINGFGLNSLDALFTRFSDVFISGKDDHRVTRIKTLPLGFSLHYLLPASPLLQHITRTVKLVQRGVIKKEKLAFAAWGRFRAIDALPNRCSLIKFLSTISATAKANSNANNNATTTTSSGDSNLISSSDDVGSNKRGNTIRSSSNSEVNSKSNRGSSSEPWVQRQDLAPAAYWSALAQHKFALCPLGHGVQSPKLFEALAVHTVPVVTGVAAHWDLAADYGFPLLIVHSWGEQYINASFLTAEYERVYRHVNWRRVDRMLREESMWALFMNGTTYPF